MLEITINRYEVVDGMSIELVTVSDNATAKIAGETITGNIDDIVGKIKHELEEKLDEADDKEQTINFVCDRISRNLKLLKNNREQEEQEEQGIYPPNFRR